MGLNLTAADIVIHYDPWWNQAAQDQASRRQMGEAARQTAEGISWERVLGVVEERLFEVINRQRGTEAGHATLAATSE